MLLAYHFRLFYTVSEIYLPISALVTFRQLLDVTQNRNLSLTASYKEVQMGIEPKYDQYS